MMVLTGGGVGPVPGIRGEKKLVRQNLARSEILGGRLIGSVVGINGSPTPLTLSLTVAKP